MAKATDQLDENKVVVELGKHNNKAEQLIKDPEKAKKKLEEAYNKAMDKKGPLEKVWEELQLMYRLMRDWISGSYKEIPTGSIIAIVGGFLYFLSPIDVIPDIIPVAGYVDDVFVLTIIIKQVNADLQKYKIWKEKAII